MKKLITFLILSISLISTVSWSGNFNKGADLWWKSSGNSPELYLEELGLPYDDETNVLLMVYFRYMMFRDWNDRNLIYNSDLDNIKEFSSAIQGYYDNNSRYSSDDVWNVAEEIFEWKYDFIGRINTSDFSYINNMLDIHNQYLYKYAKSYGLLESQGNDL